MTLLPNIERGRRFTPKASNLVKKFVSRFWRRDWPGQSRPNVYYDPRSLDLEGPKGVLHTKAVVADEESLFVTSANLTEAALNRNIEVGVLLRDRTSALLRPWRTLLRNIAAREAHVSRNAAVRKFRG